MKKIRNFFNEETNFNIKDLFVLTIIVIIYSIISFHNLGDTVAPQTFFDVNPTGLKIVLKEKTFVNQIKFYTGEHTGNYNFEISTDDKNYSNNIVLNADGCFKWKKGNVSSFAKYIRLTPRDGFTYNLGEIALYDNGGNKIPIQIKANGEIIYDLTDEASTIPENISYMNSTYFDEVYFARTAYDYLKGIPIYEWSHPPLGKLIQALPVLITKEFTPFNYRVMGNIAGILMVVVMYLFGHAMFRRRKYATMAALLMVFDNFHLTQTRLGTVDSFLALFILTSFFFMFLYMKKDRKWWQLLLSGIFIGCAIATKWTGLFAGLGLAIIYFIYKFKTKEKWIPFLIRGFAFFIIIPLLIYGTSYFITPNVNGLEKNNVTSLVKKTDSMYEYHSNVKQDHPFSSNWYTWPVTYKPIWYYTNDVDSTHKQTIVALGNILIWWPGIIAFFILPYFIVKKKNKKSLFLLISITSMLLPFVFINRPMFIYHYFIIIPFVMLAIVNLFYQINKTGKKDMLMLLYLIAVIIVFTIYYPVSSGQVATKEYIDATKLFDSWIY